MLNFEIAKGQAFYSRTAGQFYTLHVHGGNIPADSVEISDETYQQMLEGITAGKVVASTDDGFPILEDPPDKTTVEVIQELVAQVQSHLDTQARSFGYDDIRTAVTYADEPAVPKFQAEGQALRAWRSLVWGKCHSLLDEVQSGMRGRMTPDQVVAELPPPPALATEV